MKIVFYLGLKKIPATRSLPYGTCHFTYGICTNGIWNTKVPCFLMAFGYSSSKARGMERYFLSLSNELTREWMLSVLTTFNIELCLLHNENWDWNSRYHQNKQHICILFFIFLPIITIENKSNVMYHFNERKMSSWNTKWLLILIWNQNLKITTITTSGVTLVVKGTYIKLVFIWKILNLPKIRLVGELFF